MSATTYCSPRARQTTRRPGRTRPCSLQSYVSIASRRPCPNTCPVSCGPLFPTPSGPSGANWPLSGESTLAFAEADGQGRCPDPKRTLERSPLVMAHPTPSTPPLKVLLAAPRGFCAGVDRAIKIVELALRKFGAPVYVRHEIVHNRHVVDTLKGKGAIFVEDLDEIPETDAPVIFSAHGVPRSVPAAAKARRLFYLDATCPLVSKVHAEARDHHENGLEILLIGHAGHPEVVGTLGQLPPGAA